MKKYLLYAETISVLFVYPLSNNFQHFRIAMHEALSLNGQKEEDKEECSLVAFYYTMFRCILRLA